jgi:hypothetical protein
MEELGDWVYIILMVVVGISSMYSSAKKKQRQQQTQMPSPEPSEPSEPSEPWYPMTPTPKQKAKKQPPPVPRHIRQQPSTSTIPIIETGMQTEIHVAQTEGNVYIDELELDDPETYRKAIIYAEIFNRKY